MQKLVPTLLFAFTCSILPIATLAQADMDVEAVKQIRELQQQYVTSIDNADLALVDQVWSHSPDVIFIEPLGTERGLDQVEKFVSGTFGRMFSKRDLNLENPAIHVYGDTAWSEMTWTFHATLRDSSQLIVTKGRETQVLRKEHGAWHIVAIHYSGLPMTGKPQGF